MPQEPVNRTAELLGELLYRARDGSPLWTAAAAKLLLEEGKGADADQLLQAGETLSELWRARLTEPTSAEEGGTPLHPTEQARLTATDYPVDPSGRGGRMSALDRAGAARHAYRQVAYGSLGLATHPDVKRVLDEVRPSGQ